MKNLLHISIPKDVQKLLDILYKNKHSAYVCGGAIRDSILNRPVHDWDICTSATPSEMLKIFRDKKVIETWNNNGCRE